MASRRTRRPSRPRSSCCCGAIGSVVWGIVVDRAGAKRPRNKLITMAVLCVLALAVLMPAFAMTGSAAFPVPMQFALIAFGGFLMTCTVGPVSAVVIDVVHPGVRATGASVLALFQNLFGLAAGPFVTGVLSDALGLDRALAIMPACGLLAALFFLLAARTYEADLHRVQAVPIDGHRGPGRPRCGTGLIQLPLTGAHMNGSDDAAAAADLDAADSR